MQENLPIIELWDNWLSHAKQVDANGEPVKLNFTFFHCLMSSYDWTWKLFHQRHSGCVSPWFSVSEPNISIYYVTAEGWCQKPAVSSVSYPEKGISNRYRDIEIFVHFWVNGVSDSDRMTLFILLVDWIFYLNIWINVYWCMLWLLWSQVRQCSNLGLSLQEEEVYNSLGLSACAVNQRIQD